MKFRHSIEEEQEGRKSEVRILAFNSDTKKNIYVL